ncbi:MAG: hypothetical protein MK120_06415 [Puniceicoccaceae bacterium]|nr:hypothetical protein [Puniceicoccaceae bacterium]
MPKAPLVYAMLGLSGSERREILYDLIKEGIGSEEQVLYFRPKNEAPCKTDAALLGLKNISVINSTLEDSQLLYGKINTKADKIFFLAPGDSDPADFIEAIKRWVDINDCTIARVMTVVHCSFLESNPKAQAWFDACIHFSDIVLLAARAGIKNNWMKEFKDRYSKNHYPCRFLLVKKGCIQNPAEVLEIEARRISLYLDELTPIEEDELEDHMPDDCKPDKYIERLTSGQRAYCIPDIRKLL